MRKMDKERVAECISKTRTFYDTRAVGCALLKVKEIAAEPPVLIPLTEEISAYTAVLHIPRQSFSHLHRYMLFQLSACSS